jgi:hypothetical protein
LGLFFFTRGIAQKVGFWRADALVARKGENIAPILGKIAGAQRAETGINRV